MTHRAVHEIVHLARYAPEDITAIAVLLEQVALRLRLTEVARLCVCARSDAADAERLIERLEEQRLALKRRVRIPTAQRLTVRMVESRVMDARESLYVALLLGLVSARGAGGAGVRDALWAPFRAVGRQRYARWQEERELVAQERLWSPPGDGLRPAHAVPSQVWDPYPPPEPEDDLEQALLTRRWDPERGEVISMEDILRLRGR